VIVEYSANIEAELLPEDLSTTSIGGDHVRHRRAVAVRTRLMRREHYRVGDGAPENAFVHIDIRAARPQPRAEEGDGADHLRSGQQDARSGVQGAAFALTVEIHEIDPDTRLLRNACASAKLPGKRPRPHERRARQEIAKAEGLLARFRQKTVTHLIDARPTRAVVKPSRRIRR